MTKAAQLIEQRLGTNEAAVMARDIRGAVSDLDQVIRKTTLIQKYVKRDSDILKTTKEIIRNLEQVRSTMLSLEQPLKDFSL